MLNPIINLKDLILRRSSGKAETGGQMMVGWLTVEHLFYKAQRRQSLSFLSPFRLPADDRNTRKKFF